MSAKLRVCLTGATGFIGKNLLKDLSKRDDLEVVALSRKVSEQVSGAQKGNVIWKRCNGFSLIDVEEATRDVDIIIYLIHSMLPTSTLTQGSFTDFDLYLADNFARAAKTNKVKKIIYLSGIIPKDKNLSDHLLSRLEVEKTLAQFGNDLTVLRAGLIIGKNGSSFRLLERLIKRLPILVCPAWTMTLTQPIDLRDVKKYLEHCIDNYEKLSPIYDIGGADIVTYKEMLLETSNVLGKKRRLVSIPFFSPTLSKFWVARITSSENNLVYPLVESLKHEMIVDEDKRLTIEGHELIGFKDSLRAGITNKDDGFIRFVMDYNARINLRWLENASSLQRIKTSKKITGESVAKLYFSWLPSFLRPFIFTKLKDNKVSFFLFKKLRLLELEKSEERSDLNRVVYYIRGGFLARRSSYNGRFEFRWVESSSSLIIALLDFRPSLPWFIYKYTQAIFHKIIMKRFGTYLEKVRVE